jgi:hypothetical protein
MRACTLRRSSWTTAGPRGRRRNGAESVGLWANHVADGQFLLAGGCCPYFCMRELRGAFRSSIVRSLISVPSLGSRCALNPTRGSAESSPLGESVFIQSGFWPSPSARSRPVGGWVIPIGLIQVILQLRAGLVEERDSSHRRTIVLGNEEQGVKEIADLESGFDRAVTHLASSRNLIRLAGNCFRTLGDARKGEHAALISPSPSAPVRPAGGSV